MSELAEHTVRLIKPYQRPATLIGWSLGGFYARETAKLLKSRVRQVITLGTPFNEGIDYANVTWISACSDVVSKRTASSPEH